MHLTLDKSYFPLQKFRDDEENQSPYQNSLFRLWLLAGPTLASRSRAGISGTAALLSQLCSSLSGSTAAAVLLPAPPLPVLYLWRGAGSFD
jgi:hypothetical protein